MYILDTVVPTWRIRALQSMVKAYKPQVSTSFILTALCFVSEDEGVEYLRDVGCVFVKPISEGSDLEAPYDVDTKNSVIDASKAVTKDKLLL